MKNATEPSAWARSIGLLDNDEAAAFLLIGIGSAAISWREGLLGALMVGLLSGAVFGVGLLRLLRLIFRRKAEPSAPLITHQAGGLIQPEVVVVPAKGEGPPARRVVPITIAIALLIVLFLSPIGRAFVGGFTDGLFGRSATQLHNLGNEHAKAGRYADAVRAYGAALQKDPDAAVTHYGIGLAYGRMKHYDQAAHHFREALRLQPGYIEASRALSITQSNIEARAQR